MRRGILLGFPLVLVCPLLLLFLGAGGQGFERTSCGTSAVGGKGPDDAEGAGRSGSGTVIGQMPTGISAAAGPGVVGEVTTANANFKWSADAGLRAIEREARPDFITLNEIFGYPARRLEKILPGYGAYKDPVRTGFGNTAQSINNAIMWRADTWSMLDGGRVKIVEKDHAVFESRNVLWDRYAVWGVFRRNSDGAVVSVVSVHHMTNAYQFPRQWGHPPMTRAEQYGLGMDHLIALAEVLSAYGPVLVGGDMNSHPGDGPNAAAPRMQAAGFKFTKDSGVIYQFFKAPVTVTRTWELSAATVGSDHPALLTRLAMSGAGPRTTPGGNGCADRPVSVSGELSPSVNARIDAMRHTPTGLCALSWTSGAAPCTYDNQCPKVVDALYGGAGVGRGYGDGQYVAQGIIDAGLAREHGRGLDPLPPVGAVVSYDTGNGVGHVALYVGDGKIFGNDYGCIGNGIYGCVGFADVHSPGGSVTWALPKPSFDLGGRASRAS